MGTMRIGLDCRLPAYQMGGISRYILNLLPALADQDQESSYLIFHSRKDSASRLPGQAPNFRRRVLWTPPHHRLERWSLGLELLPHGLDLFHSPDFIPPAHGASRYVITVHDLNFLYYPEFLTPRSRRYYADQISWAVSRADHILADSEATRQDLQDRLAVDPERVTRVWLAADPAFALPPEPKRVDSVLAEMGLPRGFILFVGTVEPRKNIPGLLESYRRLRVGYGLDVPLVLVGGSGWLNQDVYATIDELSLADHVRQLGDVSTEKLAALYTAASVLVLPSFYEGFGLPALEAMTLGCPVVASDRASLPEVVGDAGILLPPEDADAWADALQRVLTDEELRTRLISSGHVQARQFSWERTARETLTIYRRLGHR